MTDKIDIIFLKKLGQKLREIRSEKGWTLEETEEFGSVSWRHLQRIEQGKNITILTLLKISKAYNVSLGSILDEVSRE